MKRRLNSRFSHIRKHIRKKRLITRQDRIMTLANFISILRVILAAPLVWFLEKGNTSISIIIIVLIVLSDLLDGYVARKADEITHFGKLIDPIADKVCMMVIIIFLLFEYRTPFAIFFLLLTIRDTLLVTIGIYLQMRYDIIFESIWSGKWFIGITAITMFLYVIKQPQLGIYPYIISLLLMFISTYQYFKRYLKVFRQYEIEES